MLKRLLFIILFIPICILFTIVTMVWALLYPLYWIITGNDTDVYYYKYSYIFEGIFDDIFYFLN